MPITTPRLIMRSPCVGDGKMVNAAVLESFDSLHSFMPWAEVPPSLAESEEFVQLAIANWQSITNSDIGLPIFLFDKDNQDFVGASGFHHINEKIRQLEIGYWIRSKYSGKGLMLEAVNVLTQYAFNQLGMKYIEIHCNEANTRSIKIPKQLGYHLEMIVRGKSINRIDEVANNMLVFVKKNLQKYTAIDYQIG
jgi:RimJ/RimL family protein N-acetyltransferase